MIKSLTAIVDQHQDGWFFAQPHTHGDTYLMCALMQAFKRKYTGNVTVIIKESYKVIAEMFADSIDRVVLVPDGEIMEMCRMNQSRIVAPNTPVVLHPHFLYDGRLDQLTGREGFSDKDMYSHLLGLPLGQILPVPEIKSEWREQAERLANGLGLVPGKSVILLPDGSYPSPSGEFWGKLSIALSQKGWRVVTNLYGNNDGRRLVPFAQSTGMAPPLEVLLPLAEIAGWVVSTLTGGLAIMYMAQTKCKKTVVTVGPRRGQEFRYNDNLSLKHAYPYGSQRKCDGFDYEAQEIEVTGPEDYDKAISDIVFGLYADHDIDTPSVLPVSPLFAPTSPGDLFDRISVLRIKSERIKDRTALHYVKRELLHLEAIIVNRSWTDAAESFISQLKAENIIGWEGIDYVYKNLDYYPDDTYIANELCDCYEELRDSNKRRIALKRKADELFGSVFREQKTY